MRFPYNGVRHGLVVAAALLALPASAQISDVQAEPSADAHREAAAPAPASPSQTDRTARLAGDGPLSRLDATLRNLVRGGAAARGGDAYVQVDVLAKGTGGASELAAKLDELGLEQTSRTDFVVSGLLPVRSIEAMAEIPSLRSAMAPHYLVHGPDGEDTYVSPVVAGRSFVGAVTGQANEALRADIARDQFGVAGRGVCIGVMSDSYNFRNGAAAGVASGDLPDGIRVLDELDTGREGSDEGRAMMELAYDVAPGVDFAFHTAFKGFANFAGGVVDLFQAGCQVVVDDIGISTDPMFQDGAISQAIDYIVSQGGAYFSSAGNSSNASYESDYRGTGITGPGGGSFHDFDPSSGVDAFQNVVLLPGQRIRFAFQYDEPSVLAGVEVSEYPSLYGGAEGQAPTSNYDVYILDGPSADAGILAVSDNDNPTFGAPYEFVDYTNATGAEQTVYVAIELVDGAERRLKYVNFGGTRSVIQNAEYAGASTAFGHSNAEGTFATGAAPWFNTPAFSEVIRENPELVGGAAVEAFTSFGGLDIRLDEDGNRLSSPIDRMKPDAVASDGDNNTFFGGDIVSDDDTFPNFFGTSAAAPNASAVAALMLEATGGAAPATAIYSALEETAVDILRGPGTFNFGSAPGFDDQSGFGFIRADEALAALAGEPVACSPEAPVFFADFDADGDDATFGEFAAVGNDSDGAFVNLTGCSFAAFNPFTERVTYATSAAGGVAAGGEFVLATQEGDQELPASVIPDGPGAIVLVEGTTEVGASVQDVLDRVVASVVYFNEDQVFGSARGGNGAARTSTDRGQSLLDALAAVRNEAPLAAGPVDVTLVASPNPVRGRLSVGFGAAEAGPVRASVYDALGREVAVLADGAFEAGRHEVTLEAGSFPSGVYIVRVSVGGDVQTQQVTVVR
ncbi:T9SS type A sorting domain-containing protein [Rubrivirga sp. S365]|uniref:T9SS type A sorting domain-containing protein n=1 Tax=Rubrivirga sp. S365 TaxID=3076080 RepID=UPI0028C90D37|nr:T9SS type A sorting domain-containing protein [Rubrivirga sp. S365]MDT7855317.1 T9SS type A sorting domain-containing protein [Rubrivirga sp. S365]